MTIIMFLGIMVLILLWEIFAEIRELRKDIRKNFEEGNNLRPPSEKVKKILESSAYEAQGLDEHRE